MSNDRTFAELLDTGDGMILTDGGLETTLVFEMGFDLPEFAAFPLLDSDHGRRALVDYYRPYLDVAGSVDRPIVLETPTWRASAEWGSRLGYDEADLRRVNEEAVELVSRLAAAHVATSARVSGNIGPRSDAYAPTDRMSAEEAERYHTPQIAALAAAGVDSISGMTIAYVEEAVGMVRAARSVGVPIVIWFTVETDGTLPTGTPLGQAIDAVDAATSGFPLAFGINCAHPEHFVETVAAGGAWRDRLRLVRANASRMSHEELDNAEELDAGDPVDLGRQYAGLAEMLPALRVVGGCCGTNHVHVGEMAVACVGPVTATL